MAVLSKHYRLPLLLGFLCCLIAAALVVLWYFSSRNEQFIRRQFEQPVESTLVLADPPEDNLQIDEQDRFEEIMTRPLFNKSRKPIPEDQAENNINESSVNQPVTELTARYNGYIEVPDGKVALIRDIKTRKYHHLHKGEQINEWTLTEMYPDRVVFKQGEVSEELLLRVPRNRSNKPKTGRANRVMRPATIPVRKQHRQTKPPTSARRQQLMNRIDRR
ncbi:MAG TPA: hypothetical protein ENJ32_02805 [Crenotrichaceae bacterium]|nr:hypothetical protein [Crenotrichaceae bacterium]